MMLLKLNLKPFVATRERFYELCASNPDLRIERSATGEVIIMPPRGGITGSHNMNIGAQLWNWNEKYQLGIAFDSSTGFHLPNGADRSPDASWVTRERWDTLSREEQSRFVPLCPDVVIELRSPTDNMEPLQAKMHEYMANSVQLGWLIDPPNRRVEVYRKDKPVETVQNPETLSGEPLLPRFQLDLTRNFS